MTEYIPTTEEIRNRILLGADMNDLSEEEREELAEFDRWLAEVERAAAEKALTVEMIAEVILKSLVFTDATSMAWANGVARNVLALIRGGGEQ